MSGSYLFLSLFVKDHRVCSIHGGDRIHENDLSHNHVLDIVESHDKFKKINPLIFNYKCGVDVTETMSRSTKWSGTVIHLFLPYSI